VYVFVVNSDRFCCLVRELLYTLVATAPNARSASPELQSPRPLLFWHSTTFNNHSK
jgi:hypothetical protein